MLQNSSSSSSVYNRYGIPSSVAFGHTQIYTGDAKISETGSKWATSVKNNYGAGNFIYNTQSKNYKIKDWNLIIFRANENQFVFKDVFCIFVKI